MTYLLPEDFLACAVFPAFPVANQTSGEHPAEAWQTISWPTESDSILREFEERYKRCYSLWNVEGWVGDKAVALVTPCTLCEPRPTVQRLTTVGVWGQARYPQDCCEATKRWSGELCVWPHPTPVPRAPALFNSCPWATVILLPVSLSFLFPCGFLSFATPMLWVEH